jgi:conjugative relaxase-like TrwC/TraI family protein
MLTSSKHMSVGQASSYFEDEKGYYNNSDHDGSGHAIIKGKLAEELFLAGIDGNKLHTYLTTADFEKIAALDEVISKEGISNIVSKLDKLNELASLAGKERRAGFDIQMGAPKELALLRAIMFAEGNLEMVEKIDAALKNAADASISEIEKMIGYRETKDKKTELIRGEGIVYNQIQHLLNRDGEVYLHYHHFIYNMIRTADGNYRSIENEIFFKNQDYMHIFFHAALAKELSEMGLTIEIIDPKKGTFRIIGIPEQAIKDYSKRTETIEALISEEEAKIGRAMTESEKQKFKLIHRPVKDKTLSAQIVQIETAERLKTDYAFGYEEALSLFSENIKNKKTSLEEIVELDLDAELMPQLEAAGITFDIQGIEMFSDEILAKYAARKEFERGEFDAPLKQFSGSEFKEFSKNNILASIVSERVNGNINYTAGFIVELFKKEKLKIGTYSVRKKVFEITDIPQKLRDKYIEYSNIEANATSDYIDKLIINDMQEIFENFGGEKNASFYDITAIKKDLENDIFVLKNIVDANIRNATIEKFSSLSEEELNSKIDLAIETIHNHESVFNPHDLAKCVLQITFGQGTLVSPEEISRAIALRDDLIRFSDGTMTSKTMYEKESFIFNAMDLSRGTMSPLVSNEEKKEIFNRLKRDGIVLREAQSGALNALLSTCDQFYGIQGYAGTGKTFSAALLPQLLGERVEMVGLAPTNNAADILSKDIANSKTIQLFLKQKLISTRDNVQRVYVVDEMSMVSSSMFHDLVKKITFEDPTAKVILMGDREQYNSVGAGKVFADLQDFHKIEYSVIDEIVRQESEILKSAVAEMVYKKDMPAALKILLDNDMLVEEADEQKRFEILVNRALSGQLSEAVVGCSLNRDITKINALFHEEQKKRNEIENGLISEILVPRTIDEVSKLIGESYEIGMKLVRNPDGAMFTVISCHPDSSIVMVTDGVENFEINLNDDSQRFSFYDHREVEFSIGEPVIFGRKTKIDGVEIKSGRYGKIVGIDHNKNTLEINLSNAKDKRTISLDMNEYKYLSHGYATTPQKLQGATAKNKFALLHAQITTKEAMYVSLTRAKENFFAVTNNLDILKIAALRETIKTSTYGREIDYTYEPEVNIKGTQQHLLNELREKGTIDYFITLAADQLNRQVALFTAEELIKRTIQIAISEKIVLDPTQLIEDIEKSENIIHFDKKNVYENTQLSGIKYYEMEKEIDRTLKNGINVMKPTATMNEIDEKIERLEQTLKLNDKSLTKGQLDALRLILSTKDKYNIIQGRAGAGKTFMVEKAKELAKSFNLEFVGQSFMGAAADELEKASGIKSCTIDSFLLSPERVSNPLKQSAYVIDEAGMMDAHLFAKILDRAEKENAKIFFIGDRDQFPAVGPAAMFAHAQSVLNVVEINEIRRQKEGSVAQSIVQQLAFNNDRESAIEKVMQLMKQNNMLATTPGVIVQKEAIVEDMVTEYLNGDWNKKLMISSTNEIRRKLNDLAHNTLMSKGEIKDERSLSTLSEWRLTPIEKRFAKNYKNGLIVMANSPNFFEKGAAASEKCRILRTDEKNNIITVERPSGKIEKILLSKDSDRISIFEPVERKFSVGEPIVFKKNQGSAIKNGQKGFIVDIDANQKSISINKAEIGKAPDIVKVDLASYNYFELGHALTDYNSQGKTTDSILIYANSKLANFNAFYTEITRTREKIKLWTDDVKKFIGNVKLDVEKSTTMGKTPIEIKTTLKKGNENENRKSYTPGVHGSTIDRNIGSQNRQEHSAVNGENEFTRKNDGRAYVAGRIRVIFRSISRRAKEFIRNHEKNPVLEKNSSKQSTY